MKSIPSVQNTSESSDYNLLSHRMVRIIRWKTHQSLIALKQPMKSWVNYIVDSEIPHEYSKYSCPILLCISHPFFFRLVVTHISTTHTCHFAHVTGSAIGSMGESFVTALSCGLCCDDPGKSLEHPGNSWKKKPFVGRKIGRLLCFCNAKNLFLICFWFLGEKLGIAMSPRECSEDFQQRDGYDTSLWIKSSILKIFEDHFFQSAASVWIYNIL